MSKQEMFWSCIGYHVHLRKIKARVVPGGGKHMFHRLPQGTGRTDNLLRVDFGEDGGVSIAFSEEFYTMSLEEQIRAMETFVGKMTLEPSAMTEVDQAMTRREITIALAECILAKLRMGERIEEDTDVELDLGVLSGGEYG